MSAGPFGSTALELHALGLTVMPTGGDDGKRPLVKWPVHRQSRSTVATFASKFPEANVGVLTGRSGVTVIDCDDEKTLADAEGRFGASPFVTRSPRGGGHLWFKSQGERNANLRGEGLNVDVRGVGGLILTPPSRREGVGEYRIERGSWDDLQALPTLNPGAIPERPTRARRDHQAIEGERNNKLFAALRSVACEVDCLADLVIEAHAINAQFSPPLPALEAEKVARSVWRYRESGKLYAEAGLVAPYHELEALNANGFYLWNWIKRWHGARMARGESFALSPKAMERGQVLPGWGRRLYGITINSIVAVGFLDLVHKGGRRKGDPSLYRKGARNGPNVLHPPLASPCLTLDKQSAFNKVGESER